MGNTTFLTTLLFTTFILFVFRLALAESGDTVKRDSDVSCRLGDRASFIHMCRHMTDIDCTTDVKDALLECIGTKWGSRNLYKNFKRTCCGNDTQMRVYACRVPMECLSTSLSVTGYTSTASFQPSASSSTHFLLTPKPVKHTREDRASTTFSKVDQTSTAVNTVYPATQSIRSSFTYGLASGIGITIGSIAIMVALIVFVLYYKKRTRRKRYTGSSANISTRTTSPNGYTSHPSGDINDDYASLQRPLGGSGSSYHPLHTSASTYSHVENTGRPHLSTRRDPGPTYSLTSNPATFAEPTHRPSSATYAEIPNRPISAYAESDAVLEKAENETNDEGPEHDDTDSASVENKDQSALSEGEENGQLYFVLKAESSDSNEGLHECDLHAKDQIDDPDN